MLLVGQLDLDLLAAAVGKLAGLLAGLLGDLLGLLLRLLLYLRDLIAAPRRGGFAAGNTSHNSLSLLLTTRTSCTFL